MILTRKIQLIPVGDKEEVNRVYTYIRDGIFNQNKAMNQFMTALYVEAIQEVSAEDRKELNKLYARISTSKKGSAYDESIVFPKGLGSTASLSMKVKQDFASACKKGLLYGKISLPTYRMDGPLLVQRDHIRLLSQSSQHCGIYHNYATHEEFLNYLYGYDAEVFIKFVNDITFKMVLGAPGRSQALRSEIQKIFEEEYMVHASTIQIVGKKIMLYLCIEIPEKEVKLREDVVMGVYLGKNAPVVCALNTAQKRKNSAASCVIGDKEEIFRKKAQIHAQRDRLQRTITSNSGGHGRAKKMNPFAKLSKYERNWNRTYNHYLSRNIVKFAVDNGAKYINLEFTGTNSFNDRVLAHWAVAELQQYIAYKAEYYGIEVRKVEGVPSEDLKPTESDDQAAALEIALCTEFVSKKEEKEIEEAEEKYVKTSE